MSAGFSTAAWVAGSLIASTAVSAYEGEKSRKAAKKQFNETQAIEAQARADQKAYDLAAGQDAKDSESATTIYGGDRLKKKKLTANDLLVKDSGTTGGTLGLGFTY